MTEVMEVMALDPGQVLDVLSAINPSAEHRAWDVKHRIVAQIGRHPGGCEASVRDLANALRISTNTAALHVRDLVEDKVLAVVDLGAGTRGRAYAVTRDVRRWVGVPWRRKLDAELVDLRLAAEEADRDAKPALRRDLAGEIATLRRPASRSHRTATQRGLASRSPQGQSRRYEKLASRSARGNRDTSEPDSPVVGTTGGSDASAPTTAGGEQQQVPKSPKLAALEKAIIEHALPGRHGRRYISPHHEQRLAELLATDGIEYVALMQLVMAMPRDHQVPGLIAQLERDALASLAPDVPPPPAPPPEPTAPAPATPIVSDTLRRLAPRTEPEPDSPPAGDAAARARALRTTLRTEGAP